MRARPSKAPPDEARFSSDRSTGRVKHGDQRCHDCIQISFWSALILNYGYPATAYN